MSGQVVFKCQSRNPDRTSMDVLRVEDSRNVRVAFDSDCSTALELSSRDE
jgi:hypothetical protein